FGTLLSSQGTDASFVPVSGPSGRFLRFRLYQTVSRSDFLGAFQVPAFAFPFPAAPTLSVLFRLSDHFVLRRTEIRAQQSEAQDQDQQVEEEPARPDTFT
ncbi:hypothetical protein, partial [Streptomyces melanogenes]|uniref:hypothetical protein n=1 Tax=Streptomyces melanogenes TaxID=67326 RepID=UPI0037B5377E